MHLFACGEQGACPLSASPQGAFVPLRFATHAEPSAGYDTARRGYPSKPPKPAGEHGGKP
jgi:hypothetical protein